MYLRKNTAMPVFVPLPRFVLGMDLSLNAKVLYGLLMNRAMLSQKNNWIDEKGRIYVTYTVRDMAEDMDRCERTSQAALGELDRAGLVRRVHQGRNRPNRIYVILPDTVELLDGDAHRRICAPDRQAPAPRRGKACAPDRQPSAPPDTQGLPPNIQKEYTDFRDTEGVYPPPLGHYRNVLLTEEQQEELRRDFPGRLEPYIEKLSAYMAQSGKGYVSHEAALRRWLTEDRAERRTAGVYTDEEYAEGECL